jgi:hypothetical protein
MIRVTFQFNNLLIHSTAPAMHVEPFLVNSYLPSVSQGRVKLVVNPTSLDTHISRCNFPAQYRAHDIVPATHEEHYTTNPRSPLV